MKKFLFITVLCFLIIKAFANNEYLIYEQGTMQFSSINYKEDWTITFADVIYNVSFDCEIPVYQKDQILENTFLVPNTPTITADNGVTVTAITPYYDGNVLKDTVSLCVPASYSLSYVVFHVAYKNMSTSVDISNPMSSYDSYPLNASTIPSTVNQYLAATTKIQSGDSRIQNQAKAIITGYTGSVKTLSDAVDALTQWGECNINIDNLDGCRDAVSVLTAGCKVNGSNVPSKSTQCEGSANLLAAFCRSLGIPARICSGNFIEQAVSVPLPTVFNYPNFQWGSGNGTVPAPHSCCEIYSPSSQDWIRCDPAQRTELFGWPNFIKEANETEDGINDYYVAGDNYVGYGGTGNYSAQQITQFEYCPSSTISNTSSLTASNYLTFNYGNKNSDNNTVLFTPSRSTIPTGFNDQVTIENPPNGTLNETNQPPVPVPNNTWVITPCSQASFYALFVSGGGAVWYFDWSIVLYYSGGTYTYASGSIGPSNTYTPNVVGQGCVWQPTTTALPNYNWLYDPAGNIFGQVNVKAALVGGGGDGVTNQATIGVSPYNYIQNFTYSSSATVNACAKLNLTNVIINNNAPVIFNTNGYGIVINSSFQAQKGSTLQI